MRSSGSPPRDPVVPNDGALAVPEQSSAYGEQLISSRTHGENGEGADRQYVFVWTALFQLNT